MKKEDLNELIKTPEDSWRLARAIMCNFLHNTPPEAHIGLLTAFVNDVRRVFTERKDFVQAQVDATKATLQ